MKTRKLKFVDKEIREVIQERGKVIEKGRVVNQKREKLDKELKELDSELNKLGLKAQKFQDKIRPWVNEIVLPKLEDTEDITTIDSNGDQIIVEVYDRVEEFKEALLKAKKEQKEIDEKTNQVEGKTKA